MTKEQAISELTTAFNFDAETTGRILDRAAYLHCQAASGLDDLPQDGVKICKHPPADDSGVTHAVFSRSDGEWEILPMSACRVIQA